MFIKRYFSNFFLLLLPQSLHEPARRVYYPHSTILPKAVPTIRLECQSAKQKFAVLKYLYQNLNT